MMTLAIALLALWLTALLLARSRLLSAPAAARRWNLGFILLTIAASFTSCAAPIVKLIAAFKAVAEVAPEYKSAFLSERIGETRPAMFLSLVTIPVLIAGIVAFFANRRRISQRQRAQAVVDAF